MIFYLTREILCGFVFICLVFETTLTWGGMNYDFINYDFFQFSDELTAQTPERDQEICPLPGTQGRV